jgi:glycosyltransferase involved in cell wall biosynthesis
MIKKKILFVYSNMGDGGTQRQKSILSKELSKKYDLTMALFKNEQLHKFYGKIIDLKTPASKKLFMMLKNSIQRIILLRRLFKSRNYDIVISSSLISNFFCLFVKFIFKIRIPIIVTFNNANKLKSKDMGMVGYFTTFLNRIFCNYADCIITVSKALGNELLKENYPENKIKTIYNGIDIDELKMLSEDKLESEYEKLFNNSFFKIISVGRLSIQKDYLTLLRAVKIVNKHFPCQLVILGDGELKRDLINEIEKLNLEKNIFLAGWVKNPYKFLAHSDLFVLSSLWEGFPNVLLEALGCGLPVISTDCPTGPDEIIKSGRNGYLVPVQNYSVLSEKIIEIAMNKKLLNKIRKEGKKRALEFSIQEIALKWDRLIKSII